MGHALGIFTGNYIKNRMKTLHRKETLSSVVTFLVMVHSLLQFSSGEQRGNRSMIARINLYSTAAPVQTQTACRCFVFVRRWIIIIYLYLTCNLYPSPSPRRARATSKNIYTQPAPSACESVCAGARTEFIPPEILINAVARDKLLLLPANPNATSIFRLII